MSIRTVTALAAHLEITERWQPGRLHELQARYAARLFAHALTCVPYYRDRHAAYGPAPVPGTAAWRDLPLLRRVDLLHHAAALRDPSWRTAQGALYKVSTSGSTGEPVTVWRTPACRDIWQACTLREHRWQGRDAAKSVAIIRAGTQGAPAPQGRRVPRGSPFDQLWRCGPTHMLDLTTDVRAQAEWLLRVAPDYLLTYPANLSPLLEAFRLGPRPPTSQVACVGGAVSPELRTRCREVLGCAIAANYSSQELGLMALDCPHCGQYHVQSESVVLELLDESGQPCRDGEPGRVVVTDLHNLGMPLIRYEIGDYACAGQVCGGGVTLPTIREFLGRQRNMLVHADGRRHWPLTGFAQFRDVAPVLRYQVVQHDYRDIELLVAVETPLTGDQAATLTGLVSRALNGDFQVRLSAFPGVLPPARGGKFEEFVSLVV